MKPQGVAAPVPVVVVGCGAVSQNLYAPALSALEAAGLLRVVGLVDPAVEPRAVLARSFPRAHAFDAIEASKIGAGTLVIVATPPRFHAEQTIHALRQGAAVLCEKPMASSLADADAMLATARETGGLLAVGIFRRFFPAFEALQEIVERQPFGALRSFAINEGGKFAWGAASDSFFRRDLTMGGVFYDVGVYVVDLLLWLLDEPVAFTYEDDAMGGVEANCRLDLAFAEDVRGTVRLSRDWPTRNRYEFRFERANVTYRVGQVDHLHVALDGMSFDLNGRLVGRGVSPGGIVTERAARTGAQSFTEQIRNVIGAMMGDEPLRVPGEEGIRSLRFISRCYESRRLMTMPWLTSEERSAARTLAGVPS